MVDRAPEVHSAVQNGAAANIIGKAAIPDAEGRAGIGAVDAVDLPPTDDLPDPSLRFFGRGNVPGEVGDKAVADVIFRITIVQVRVERIKETQLEVAGVAIAERRDQVIPVDGVGVTGS